MSAAAGGTVGGTAAGRPPDGAPPRQLRSFLELGAVQLDAALKEADARVGSLANAVSGLSTDARGIEQFAGELLSGDAAQVEHARGRIGELAGRLSAHAYAAITALQFYDKLVQRLSHVRDGLVIPADRHHDAMSAADWESLLDQVRSHYSMVEERVMFDFLMRGVSANSMLSALVSMQDKGDTGELELF